MMRRLIIKARMVLAARIMGDGWTGYLSSLALIRDRAKAAIHEDGSVTLADCPALAEALYGTPPGIWTLTIARPLPPLTPLGTAIDDAMRSQVERVRALLPDTFHDSPTPPTEATP